MTAQPIVEFAPRQPGDVRWSARAARQEWTASGAAHEPAEPMVDREAIPEEAP